MSSRIMLPVIFLLCLTVVRFAGAQPRSSGIRRVNPGYTGAPRGRIIYSSRRRVPHDLQESLAEFNRRNTRRFYARLIGQIFLLRVFGGALIAGLVLRFN